MPFDTTVRVRYEETDQMRVVYHSNYFVYFEVGRVELLRSLGIVYRELEEQGFALAVADVGATFHKPARYDDLLTVRTRIGEIGKTRLTMHYRVLRGEELLCSGHTTHAFLLASQGLKPTRIPEAIRAALAGVVETEW